MPKTYDIETDTPILPWVIAETVIEEVENGLGCTIDRATVDRLIAFQAGIYQRNAKWRKKMRAAGNRGRDTLYCFMRHWLAADLAKNRPAVYRRLPSHFLNGLPLKP